MENRRKKILIIDPDEEFAARCSTILQQQNYHIELGARFCEAVKKLSESHFDCLIMAVNLPEIKGYEAVSIIRSIKPKIRIILTATTNSKKLESKVREQNVFYYFIKPFGKEELILAINNAFKDNRRNQT